MMSAPIYLRAPLISTTTTTTTTTPNKFKSRTKSESKSNISNSINRNNNDNKSNSETTSSTPPSERNSIDRATLPTTNQLLGEWHVTHSTLPMWKDKRNVSITYALLPPLVVSDALNSKTSSTGPLGPPGTAENKTEAEDKLKLTRLDDTVRYEKQKNKKRKEQKTEEGGNRSSDGSGSGGVSTVRGIDTAVIVPDDSFPTTELKVGQEQEHQNHMRWRWKGTGLLTRWFSSEWEVLGFGNDDYGDDDEEEKKGNHWVVTYFSKTLVTPAGIDILSRRPTGPKKETVEKIRKALREVPNEDVQRLEGMIFEVETE